MKALRWLYRNLLEWITGAMLLVIVLLTITQVFSRYVINSPLTWTDEVCQLLLVWAAFLGSAVGVKRDSHLKIDFGKTVLPASVRRLSILFVNALVLAVALSMIIYGWEFYMKTGNDNSTSLGFSRNLFYLPIPVSGVLMTLSLIPATIRAIRDPDYKNRQVASDQI
jgi:TRAP-type transport system small permease protein